MLARKRVLALPFRLALVTVVGAASWPRSAPWPTTSGVAPRRCPSPSGSSCARARMFALAAVPLYALARAALVPLAQRHADEAPPRGRPLSLRVQLGYTVFAVATAALVPATVFGMAQLDRAAAGDAHARAEKTAARLAASAAELDVAEATRLLTRTPLAGARARHPARAVGLAHSRGRGRGGRRRAVRRARARRRSSPAARCASTTCRAPSRRSPLMVVTLACSCSRSSSRRRSARAVAHDARGVAEQIARVAERRRAAARSAPWPRPRCAAWPWPSTACSSASRA